MTKALVSCQQLRGQGRDGQSATFFRGKEWRFLPFVGVLCAVLLFPCVALGKPLYVSCYREVPLQVEAQAESETLAILKSGQEVSLIRQEENFYLVSLVNGTTGYILKSYMTSKIPAENRLQEIEAKAQQLRELEALQTQTQEQEQQLLALRVEREQLLAANKKAETTAYVQTHLVTQLQTQVGTLKDDKELRWFMTGGVILFIGVVCGRFHGNAKQRNLSRSLKWEAKVPHSVS